MMITPASVFPSSTDRLRAGISVDGTPGARTIADLWGRMLQSDPRISWPKMLAQTLDLVSGKSTAGLSPEGTIRAGFSASGFDAALTGLVNLAFFSGYDQVPDSTVGWTTPGQIANFLPGKAIGLYHQSRLAETDKGPAPDAEFSFLGQYWNLRRFSRQFVLSEVDMLSSPSVNLSLTVARGLGAAARRVPIDLTYSLILGNVVMSDGERLFSVAHGNLQTGANSALAVDGAIEAAIEAVGIQGAPDVEFECPIPVGTWGKYLIVPPSLVVSARRLARLMLVGKLSDNLEVRQEARLQLGTVSPTSGEIIPGTRTGWLLCSPAEVGPSIIVGTLEGEPRPELREYSLGGPGQFAGKFGTGWDCKFDCGAVALDYRPLYFGAGA